MFASFVFAFNWCRAGKQVQSPYKVRFLRPNVTGQEYIRINYNKNIQATLFICGKDSAWLSSNCGQIEVTKWANGNNYENKRK